jgi:spore photoproduct lyase
MKKASDIKAIVYGEQDSNNQVVRAFLALEGPRRIPCRTDSEIAVAVEELKNDGYASKQVLVLTRNKGRALQRCPGSRGMICCRYLVLNTGFNCLYSCSYCYLNSYLNSFGVLLFINFDDALEEIREFQRNARGDLMYRVGTGEFTDSLMLDDVAGTAERLIHCAGAMPNVLVELKTKSANVDHLLGVKEKQGVVFAWSLNTPRAIKRYESDTATLDERLGAAARAAGAGFPVAFHFDPIIPYEGWEREYGELVARAFHHVPRGRLVWISLGCFRYSHGFKETARENFPADDLVLMELFSGRDGKSRYLPQVRREIYKRMKSFLDREGTNAFVYLCMEDSAMWNDVFTREYNTSDDLERDFSDHVKGFVRSIRGLPGP